MLPDNIVVHKPKNPKNWSYVLKTTDIIPFVDQNILTKIFYNTSVHQSCLLTIIWRGLENPPYFYIEVRVVKAEYKHFLKNLIIEEVLPIIKNWICNINHSPVTDNLTVNLHNDAITIKHNDKQIWSKEIVDAGYDK